MYKRTSFIFLFTVLFYSNVIPAPINDDARFTIVEKNALKGLFDEEGTMIIPIEYEDLGWIGSLPIVYNKVIGYKEKGHWGLIDVKNHKVTEPRYYSLSPFYDKLIIASRGTSNSRKRVYGLINTKGEIDLSFRYYSLQANNEQLIASVIVNGQPGFGVINDEGQAIIGLQHKKVVSLSPYRYAVYNADDKLAVYTSDGEAVTSFNYDSISSFDKNHLATVYKNGKQGVIREDGSMLVPVEYQKVRIDEKGEISVLPFNQWHAYNGNNQKLSSYTFQDMHPAGVNLYQVKLGKLSTFVDQEGKFVLTENWQIDDLKYNFAILKKGRKYGVMSRVRSEENEIILDTIYDTLYVEEKYILAAQKLDQGTFSWSLFNESGQQLTSYVYQDIKPSSEGFFAAKRKNYWGYLNTKGEEVIPCQYLSASPFRQSRASVDFIDGQGIIDTFGQWTIKPFKYRGASLNLERIHDDLYVFSTKAHRYEAAKYGLVNNEGEEIYVSSHQLINNGHTVWERNDQGKYGLINYAGARILETKYDTISALQEGTVYTFQKEGNYGIMSKQGKILVDLSNNFQELYTMSNHYLGVKIEEKFGFVDTLGRLRIANRYDSISHFKSNMAAIKLLNRWGYIDRSEHLVVQPHFEKAYPFIDGLAIVRKEGKYGMVNKKGETIVPNEYDKISPSIEGRYLVEKYKDGSKQQTLVGLVSSDGHPLIYPKYDSLEDLGNGFVIISRNDRYGLLTMQGRSTIPLRYNNIKYDPFNDLYLVLEEQGWKTIDIPISQAGK
ncbi:WG repeat-containing protein [Catalinimonas niigatensis]|uniref:WG repeat-containing protein n=1 Tax=Catalinimonas niigatensis TaxID=1397264 RepID=UPI0026655537|nr:WG repeat-containing protein [Catalinimonas niigatensis]WPP49014.1 WG repeat-containing protein [Catalinimonas niigatensis]